MPAPQFTVVSQVLKTLMGTRSDWRLSRPSRPTIPLLGSHWVGPVLAIASIGVGWFAFAHARGDGAVGFALFIGSVSILMMAWSNLLATRIVPLEQLFGGLDRMYRWHRWFGALSVGAMWLHIQMVDDVKGIRGASRDIADAAEDLAETGSNILYVLVAVSFLRWLPTRWWRVSHKFLVLPYAFSSWHFYTSTKPYANASVWGTWFTGFMILGLVGWAYRVVWRDVIRRGRHYRVSKIVDAGHTVEIELEPIGAPMRYNIGQFAFLKFGVRGMSEPHPFTIASSPEESELRFFVKNLGDWTDVLPHRIQVGSRVQVEGPYGALPLFPNHSSSDIVWIAGGVGVTPFLGAACSRMPDDGPVPHLFYCVRSIQDASGLAQLQQAAQEGRIVLHVHASSQGHRLRSQDIANVMSPDGYSTAHVVMCGPDGLVKSMRTALRTLGVRHIHVEGFDIRTGIGPDLSRTINNLVTSIIGKRAPRRHRDSTHV
jgi:predicted ferric reductase